MSHDISPDHKHFIQTVGLVDLSASLSWKSLFTQCTECYKMCSMFNVSSKSSRQDFCTCHVTFTRPIQSCRMTHRWTVQTGFQFWGLETTLLIMAARSINLDYIYGSILTLWYGYFLDHHFAHTLSVCYSSYKYLNTFNKWMNE